MLPSLFDFCPHGCPCGYHGHPVRQCRCTPGQAISELSFSARAYTHVLRIARTIADLEAVESNGDENAPIRVEHVSEAINYRSLDRNLWA